MATPEIAVALLSDTHIGRRSKSYNVQIFQERLSRWEKAIKLIVDLHRKAYPIDQLYVLCLGDMVQGERVDRQMMLEELEIPVMEQVQVFADSLASALDSLHQDFTHLSCYGVPGNHGPVGRKPLSSTSNWDLMAYLLLQRQAMTNINFPDNGQDYMIAEIPGAKMLLKHGTDIPMVMTVPFYGITTRALRWKQSIPGWDTMCLGHFHTINELCFNRIPIFMNGTFVSGDEYPVSRLGLEADVRQWLFGVHPEHGVTWRYHIRLEE